MGSWVLIRRAYWGKTFLEQFHFFPESSHLAIFGHTAGSHSAHDPFLLQHIKVTLKIFYSDNLRALTRIPTREERTYVPWQVFLQHGTMRVTS